MPCLMKTKVSQNLSSDVFYLQENIHCHGRRWLWHSNLWANLTKLHSYEPG